MDTRKSLKEKEESIVKAKLKKKLVYINTKKAQIF